MGGKSSTSTQQVSIPPEVLARYNSVNATAEQAASQPFQAYNGQFVAPLSPTQQAGIDNTNSAAGQAQPYYQTATDTLMGAQQSTSPYYQAATQALMSGMGQGAAGTQGAYGSVYGANAAAQPLQQAGAYNMGAAYAGAQPYNAAAGQEYGAGLAAAQPFNQQAAQGINQAYQGAQPYNAMATGLAGAGAQGVNAQQIGGQQIGQFMSPYIQSVLQGTEGMLNQQNQQAMSGQTGNAIMSGAFGGDRAGIAAANLAQQQQLANAQTYSGILNQGYGQALSAAQQQQGVNLGAAQANRAALQQASGQMLGIGQQGYAQGLGAAQQQAALGQQLFGQGQTAGQNLAALGQQQYGQGMGLASGQTGLGQQLFSQGMTNAQQQAALAQQQYAQGLGGSSALASLGQGIYGTGAQTAQQLAALGTGAQGASLQGAQAQLAAGQTQQQTQQAQDTALYNQFLQQQSYPFQTAQFLANIAEGTGSLSGSTTTSTQPGGFFSDERLKENIKPIGKTNDGQTIYSYNYKGDHRTQIGLLAQEVEKHHPEAVGLSGGYKTVDYGKATDHAAERGHFAFGGSPGFDPALANEMLQAQQGFYGGVAGPASGGGGPYGGLGRVPQAQPGNYVLHPASGNIQKPKSAASTINEDTDAAKDLYAMGKGAKGLYDKFTDKPLENSDLGDLPLGADDAGDEAPRARGGLAGAHGYADGGMPYGEEGSGLNIPDEQKSAPQLATAQGSPGKGRSGMDDVMDVAKIAAMFMKTGGRVGFADGGYKDGGRAQRAAGGLAGRQHFWGGGFGADDNSYIATPDQGGGDNDDDNSYITSPDQGGGDNDQPQHPAPAPKPGNFVDWLLHGLTPEEQKARGVGPEAASAAFQKNNSGLAAGIRQNLGIAPAAPAPAPAAARDPAWRPFQGTFGGGDSSATTGDQNGVKIPLADTMANAPQNWKDAIAARANDPVMYEYGNYYSKKDGYLITPKPGTQVLDRANGKYFVYGQKPIPAAPAAPAPAPAATPQHPAPAPAPAPAAARDPAWRPFQGTFGGGDSSATTGDQNGVKIPIADTMAKAPQNWKDAIARDLNPPAADPNVVSFANSKVGRFLAPDPRRAALDSATHNYGIQMDNVRAAQSHNQMVDLIGGKKIPVPDMPPPLSVMLHDAVAAVGEAHTGSRTPNPASTPTSDGNYSPAQIAWLSSHGVKNTGQALGSGAPSGGVATPARPHRASGTGHGLGSPSVAAPPPAPAQPTAPAAQAPAPAPAPAQPLENSDLGDLPLGEAAQGAPGAAQSPQSASGTATQDKKQGGLFERLLGGAGAAAGNTVDGAGNIISNTLTGAGRGMRNYAQGLRGGDEQNWVPFLTGLAAMGTAPTRNFGVALASGLGAGAQAYPQLQTQQAKLQAQNLANLKAMYPLYQNGYSFKEDPNGQLYYGGKRYTPVRNASGMEAADGTQAKPSRAWDSYTAWNNMRQTDPNGFAANSAAQQKVIAERQAALNVKPLSNSLAKAIVSSDPSGVGSLASQGPFAQVASDIAARATALAAAVGHPEIQFGAKDIANRTTIDKINNLISLGADPHSVKELESSLSSMPNSSLPRATNIHLAAQQMVQQQTPIDRYEVYKRFGQANGMSMAPNGFRVSDAEDAYNSKFDSGYKAQDQAAMEALMNNSDGRGHSVDFNRIMGFIESGDAGQRAQAQAALEAIRPGLSRYFLTAPR